MERDVKYSYFNVIRFEKTPLYMLLLLLPLLYTFERRNHIIHAFIVKKYSDWCIDDPNVIDIYIMWVNGSDPKWFKRMIKTSIKHKRIFDDDYYVNRFQDNNELMWSLRSVEKYVPWVNKIHIVTDKQYPVWMNISHPKLHFVNHGFLFYPGFHSYNSNAIQFLMYRIPGISRRVIVMDDDCIFMNYIPPNYFFDEYNRTVIHTHRYNFNYSRKLPRCHYKDTGRIYRYGIAKSHRVIYKRFNATLPIKNAHLQNPVDIKTLFEINSVFKLKKQIFSPFRKCGDYQFQTFVNLYSAITNRSVPTPNKEEGFVAHTPEKLMQFDPNNQTVKLICINFYDENFYDEYMPLKFPDKSEFEL